MSKFPLSAIASVAFLVITAGYERDASAGPDPSIWSSVGAACTAIDVVGAHVSSGGAVTTSLGGATSLLCSIPNLTVTCQTLNRVPLLRVLVKGTSTLLGIGGVVPTMVKMNKTTGVETIIANANGNNIVSDQVTSLRFLVLEPLDFTTFAYYVQIELLGSVGVVPTQQTLYLAELTCAT